MSIAWILGSGFSRPLGGPLLNQLLAERAKPSLSKQYPGAPWTEWNGAFGAYKTGLEAQLWDDAEAFLDYLDRAATGPSPIPAEVICQVLKDSLRDESYIQQLLRSSRQVIAAQCNFAYHADTGAEVWQSYVDWAKRLDPGDALLTFNYDRVLETLGTAKGVPISDRTVQGASGSRAGPNDIPIFKLHGSIDWLQIEGVLSRKTEPTDAFLDKPESLVIAAPGTSKQLAVDGPLKQIWDAALERVRDADRVVFIGYRFPPSDTQAMRRILGTIRAYPKRAHIVLGPDSPDIPRLKGLLEHALPNGDPRITVHPLFAQDFLTMVDLRRL